MSAGLFQYENIIQMYTEVLLSQESILQDKEDIDIQKNTNMAVEKSHRRVFKIY